MCFCDLIPHEILFIEVWAHTLVTFSNPTMSHYVALLKIDFPFLNPPLEILG